MNWLVFAVLVVATVWLIAAGLTKRGKVYEYPFFAGTTFLGFVVPQLPAYADDPFLPEGVFAKTVLFTVLCVAACGAGWAAGNRPMRMFNWRFDERRLLWLAALLSLSGSFFYFKLSRLPKEEVLASQWTGSAVAYLFFARVLYYGFVTALLCFVRRPRAPSLIIILFGAILILDRIVIGGRKGEITEFFLAVLIAAWFQRRFAVPRAIMLSVMIAGGISLQSTGAYRNISQGEDSKWSDISKIDMVGNFMDLLQNGGVEVYNAMLRINFVDHS